MSGGTFECIDFPEVTLTRAFGINGDIVGTYVAGGTQRAYAPHERVRKSAIRCMVVFFRGTNCSIYLLDHEINLYG